MSVLRPLLRLPDKVAAEGRRLKQIGGPPLRWVAPVALLAAAALHGMLLLLPVPQTRAALLAPSLTTDFPLVWRPEAAAVPPPPPIQAPRPIHAAPVAPQPAATRPAVAVMTRPTWTEPVPEPAPELTLTMISADVEAIIPNPDPPPEHEDVGPQAVSRADAPPSLIDQVPPVYPLAARSIRAEGKVTLRLFVLPDGSIGRAIVEESSRPGLGFEAAALAAVKRWRYEPAPLQTGMRKVSVTVHFQRQEARP